MERKNGRQAALVLAKAGSSGKTIGPLGFSEFTGKDPAKRGRINTFLAFVLFSGNYICRKIDSRAEIRVL
jgi:hypothetical protein